MSAYSPEAAIFADCPGNILFNVILYLSNDALVVFNFSKNNPYVCVCFLDSSVVIFNVYARCAST